MAAGRRPRILYFWRKQVEDYKANRNFVHGLLAGVLKIEHIREKSDFLLSNMAFFFIPAGVSIINYFDLLKSNLWQIAVICAVSTFVTFGVTAFSIRLTKRLMERGR